MTEPAPKVYVGMSGGVDSSVTAALLKEQGYRVTGVYMKNWTQDLPGFVCPWADDLADAKRVAVQLDIPFKVFDFQKEYKQQVVDYMIAEYRAGRTPNPDVMCNQQIKFDVFLRAALAEGADLIATGHYARVGGADISPAVEPARVSVPGGVQKECSLTRSFSEHVGGGFWTAGPGAAGEHERAVTGPAGRSAPSSSSQSTAAGEAGAAPPTVTRHQDMSQFHREGAAITQVEATPPRRERRALFTGLDKNKDQSYFLYRITAEALSRTLLPIGELTKPEVREHARRLGLVTAEKKDSQGICFVGKIGIKEFLQNYIQAEPGDIVDQRTGNAIGQHDGAVFYTIGQRHGLHMGGGLPFYVVGKDMAKNIVYVTTDLNDQNLWRRDLHLTQLHWITEAPELSRTYQVRTRYRAALVDCRIEHLKGDEVELRLDEPERALAPGQSAVLYDGDRVVGGGTVV